MSKLEVEKHEATQFEELSAYTGEPVYQLMEWFVEEYFDKFKADVVKHYREFGMVHDATVYEY